MFEVDRLLGSVYTMPIYIGNTIAGSVDVTITALDGPRVRIHCENGEKAWIPLVEMIALVEGGEMVEAMRAPFVLPRTAKDRRPWRK